MVHHSSTTASWWQTVKDVSLGIIFPEPALCVLCRAPRQDADRGFSRPGLCQRCANGILRHDVICSICGRHIEASQEPLCQDCIQNPRIMYRARSYGRYHSTLETLIKSYKYQGDVAMKGILGDLLVQAYDRYYENDSHVVLVPVPMHEAKERRKGFNHARELAQYVAKKRKLQIEDKLLVKVEDRDSQTTQNRKARFAVLSGCYAVDPQFQDTVVGAYVLLIDDVFTTGATADACAMNLFQEGAASVEVLTVAR